MIMLQTKLISSGLFPWKQNYVRGCKFAIFKDGKLLCVIQLERLEKKNPQCFHILDDERANLGGKTVPITEDRMPCFLGINERDY